MFDTIRTDRTGSRSVDRSWSGHPVLAVVILLCLLAAGCGSDGVDDGDAASASSTSDVTSDVTSGRTVVTAEDAGDGTTTTSTGSTTTADLGGTTTEAPEPDDDGIDGEPLDFGPGEGTPLAIVGVAHDDTLNFRAAPSPDAEILESFGPLADDLDTSSLGEAWTAPSGVWWKVEVAGSDAWANQAYLGSLGSTFGAFDEVASELGVLMFDTVEAAALAVAETRASEDPESRIVFAGEPLAFDGVGFAIVDVLDLGDDAVKGERIRIDVEIAFDEESGEEGAQDVAFVVLTNVGITPICGRGVSAGLCT